MRHSLVEIQVLISSNNHGFTESALRLKDRLQNDVEKPFLLPGHSPARTFGRIIRQQPMKKVKPGRAGP